MHVVAHGFRFFGFKVVMTKRISDPLPSRNPKFYDFTTGYAWRALHKSNPIVRPLRNTFIHTNGPVTQGARS